MKKTLLLIALIFSFFAGSAQDTANVRMTDSARMYVYNSVYVILNTVTTSAPGSYRNFPGGQEDSTKWVSYVSVKIFASKSDAQAGRPELFIKYLPVLYTDKFPTQKEILDRMRSGIK